MQGQRLKFRGAGFEIAVAVIALGLALTACQTTGQPSGTSSNNFGGLGSASSSRQLAQAEKLAREQHFAASAQMYEDVAKSSSPELRDRILLRAAREWLRANELTRGQNLLAQVGGNVPASDNALRGLVTARAALLSRQPEQALSELDRIPQPLSREDAPAVLELRAQALFAYGRPAGAVITALDRERLLSDAGDIMRNRRMIWDGVQRSAATGANMQAPTGSGRIVAGWLDLGAPALAAARDPYAAHQPLDAWRIKYPEHPANEFLNQQVMPQLRAAITFPPQIAMVLPLSGNQQVAGQVVRDGFIAAVLQQPSEQRPMLRMYDSAASGAVAAYAQAVADGAKFVVGPLTKDEVTALAKSQQISVPTLALNTLPEQTDAQPTATPNLFQFVLDPADEARQVARRIISDGLTHGIAVLPKTEWGDRVYRAFEAELRSHGGTVVGQNFYDRKVRDFRESVLNVLLLSESNARAAALSAAVGGKLEFEPRPRSDVQFIFMGAEPAQGRLLRPTIRFHLVDQVPIYSTSDIYEPDATANADLDGVNFPDMPWLIAPDEAAVQLRAALNRYWPGRARERGRLYALGYDTFRLIPLLLSQSTNTPTNESNGVTGRLSIDGSGRVHRDLNWARITNGRPQLLDGGAINTLGAPTASTGAP